MVIKNTKPTKKQPKAHTSTVCAEEIDWDEIKRKAARPGETYLFSSLLRFHAQQGDIGAFYTQAEKHGCKARIKDAWLFVDVVKT